MSVICIDNNNLPQGAELYEGREYEIEHSETNMMQQKIVFIKGIVNEGTTKAGFPWRGFKSERFVDTENIYKEEKEVNYALN